MCGKHPYTNSPRALQSKIIRSFIVTFSLSSDKFISNQNFVVYLNTFSFLYDCLVSKAVLIRARFSTESMKQNFICMTIFKSKNAQQQLQIEPEKAIK